MKTKKLLVLFTIAAFFSCVQEDDFTEANLAEDNSSQAKYVFVNEEYSIMPNDGIDDSQALQQAINESNDAILVIDAGIYHLDCPIVFTPEINIVANTNNSNVLNPTGLKIQGDGINSTIFINRSDDYAFKLIGVKNSSNELIPYKFQTNGFFTDFSIYSPSLPSENTGICNTNSVAPKGGVLMFGSRAFSFNNFSVIGFENNQFSENGIYIPLVSSISSFLSQEYSNFSISEFDINVDSYASTSTRIENVTIDYCDIYAVNGENGLGFNFSSKNLKIYRCENGGIYTAGHSSSVEGGLITGCGFNGNSNTAGIIIDRVQANPNGFNVKEVEFDGNNNHHIWLKSSINAEVTLNRFVNSHYIKSACNIGGFYNFDNYVSGINVNNNFFRYGTTTRTDNNGIPLNDVLLSNFESAVELNNRINFSIVRDNNLYTDFPNEINGSNFYEIKPGFSQGNNLVIHDGITIVDNSNSPFFIVDNRYTSASNLIIPTGSNRIKIDWSNIIQDSADSFDLISESYYTTSIGYYTFNLTLGIDDLAVGKTIKIDFGYEENGNFIPLNSQFHTSNSNGYNTITFSSNVYLSNSKNIEVRITNNSGDAFRLLSGPNVTNFSGNLN
jgi:hypothetical protein